MVDTMRVLFPGASVHFGPPEPDADYDFRFVPNASRPNLVVPAAPARAAARTVMRFSAASSIRDSGSRFAAGLALGMGAVRASKDSITIRVGDETIVQHLQEVLGQPVAISVGIGSARVNRKPVLEVFDGRGRTLAFVKMGVDGVSRRDVLTEGDNLQSLVGRVPQGVTIPRVLHSGLWNDHVVLVMSALPTRLQRPGVRRNVPVQQMDALSRAWGADRRELAATPFWHGQRKRAEGLVSGEVRERLCAVLDKVEARWGSTLVETGAWHGDWTPWNMAWRRGQLQLWDFERLDRSGLVGLDVVHYAVNESMQRAGVTHSEVARAATLATRLLGCAPDTEDLMAAAYMSAISLRYFSAASGERGELIVDRAEFMAEALEQRLHAQ